MNWLDYLILIGIVIAIICVIVWLIRRRKQGKSMCSSCPYNGSCSGKSCK